MNYKDLIITQISDHFKKAKLTRVKFEYDLEANTCNVEGISNDGENINFILNKEETSMFKNLLIKGVKKILNEDFLKLVVDLDVNEPNFKIYVVDLNNSLKPVNFL